MSQWISSKRVTACSSLTVHVTKVNSYWSWQRPVQKPSEWFHLILWFVEIIFATIARCGHCVYCVLSPCTVLWSTVCDLRVNAPWPSHTHWYAPSFTLITTGSQEERPSYERKKRTTTDSRGWMALITWRQSHIVRVHAEYCSGQRHSRWQ